MSENNSLTLCEEWSRTQKFNKKGDENKDDYHNKPENIINMLPDNLIVSCSPTF